METSRHHRAGERRDRQAMPIALALCAAAATVAAGSAYGRAYQEESLDGLTARCTTVNTTTLPRASLELYGVEADEDRGLLSCVVQSQGVEPRIEPPNVEAQIEASYHAIGQVPASIDIREVRQENLVTYLGTYAVPGTHPLVFQVTVQVNGARLEMSFDDRAPHI